MGHECRAEHIAVGSEIVLGQILNTHARTVSMELHRHGFFVLHHSAVGDNAERIIAALRLARERSNVIIVTGGLGPTADDLTKETLAQVLGRTMEFSADAMRQLESFFERIRRPMPEQNRKQALCIVGGELLPNPNGTAPGQYIQDEGMHYFLLPGPPLEMEPMLRSEVIPRLLATFGGMHSLVSRELHLCGIGESQVDEAISHLTSSVNPTVAPLASEGEMMLRITASAESDVAARALIQPVEEELLGRYGKHVYGFDRDNLPTVTGRALRAAGATIAAAESCTGGLLSSMITAVPGSSEYMVGAVIAYHNAVKQQILHVLPETLGKHGAVSEEVAEQMAVGVRQLLGSTYGISLTGIAGPAGGTDEKPVGIVFGGLSGPNQTVVYRLQFLGSREQIRLRAAKHMLWRLWRLVSDELER